MDGSLGTQPPPPDKRALNSIRLLYFARYGALAFYIPFINLFFRRHDLSGAEIGVLGTFFSASALIAAPVWGRWSDTARRPTLVIQISLALGALWVYLLGQQSIFAMMAIFMALNGMSQAGIEPLSDALAMVISRGENYGSLRLWGSIGWAVLVLAAGWLIEQFGLPIMFAGYVILMVGAAIVVTGARIPADAPRPTENRDLRQGLASLFANPAVPPLFVALALTWFTMTSLLAFEPIYLDELGAGETIIGLSFTLAALIESGAMLWVDRRARTVSPTRLLQLGLLAGIARNALVLLAPSVPFIVAARMLEGPGYALRQISIVLLLSRLAPPGQRAMLMALGMGTLLSVVQIVGMPLAGIVFDTVGAYWLYAIALTLQVIAILILQAILPKLAADTAPTS